MLHLTFLGTSAGVPTKSRNVTGLAIECLNPFGNAGHQPSRKNKPWILVDCGEATQHQLLKTNISSHQLAVICITHVHGDHCYGLPGMLASMAMSGRKQPLTLIAPQAIESFLKVLKQTTQLYLPFEINFVAIEELLVSKPNSDANSSLETEQVSATVSLDLSATHQLNIEVIKLSHRVDAYGFRLTQTLQIQ